MMTSFRRNMRILLTVLAVVAGLTAWVSAEEVLPVHLVGHEDALLLQQIQDLIDDWDPRKLTDPVTTTARHRLLDGTVVTSMQLRRPDLVEFIADTEAALVLGKALFWEMQSGSDFRRLPGGKYVGTACASCHYRHGADARTRGTARIPYVAWKKYDLDQAHPDLGFGETPQPFDVVKQAALELQFPPAQMTQLSMIAGSSGVQPYDFKGLNGPPGEDTENAWISELWGGRSVTNFTAARAPSNPPGSVIATDEGWRPEWSMFIENNTDAGRYFRQITSRNSPTVINSGFSDRLFHDGRAESTFNGFSIFGDRDQRPVLYRAVPGGGPPVHVKVAITKAALASQAVGPVVNDVEMSYAGRSFPNLAEKLLCQKVLAYQDISEDDGLLGDWVKEQTGPDGRRSRRIGKDGTYDYRTLIQQAFRREWWDGGEHLVSLELMGEADEDRLARGSLMHANFSLYWGLSIMLYESSLVSNQSPFDAMMLGDPVPVNQRWEREKERLGDIRLDRFPGFNDPSHPNGASVFQHGFRVFTGRGCVECHGGPLFSETYERLPEPEKLAISATLERILLPNSKSDAIALKRLAHHAAVISEVARQIAATTPELTGKSELIALRLDLLRESARGDLSRLETIATDALRPLHLESIGGLVARLLMDFEKHAVERYGDRAFFTEEERVALAEQLMGPVLVENMPIPPRLVEHRPPLPIGGAIDAGTYAFYDLGYYAISVSPPRYDRGVGGMEGSRPTLAAVLKAVENDVNDRLDSLQDKESAAARNLSRQAEKLKSYRAAEKGEELFQTESDQINRLPGAASTALTEEQRAVRDIESQVEKVSRRILIQQSGSGAPGQAYRFNPLWSRAETATPKIAPPQTVTPRGLRDGPKESIDAQAWGQQPLADTSWDRIDVPERSRRSNYIFKSRARTLVSDEEPWGFRKPLLHDNELAFWGAFKTPTLRNVELTGPYMHNGSLPGLTDVIDFYDGGGNFSPDIRLNPDKHPEILPLELTAYEKLALEFFLLCLTDERVRLEQSPFDHPSLELVHGYSEGTLEERIDSIAATGRNGAPEKIPIVPCDPASPRPAPADSESSSNSKVQ